MFASKSLVNLSKLNKALVLKRETTTAKTARLLNPLRPKTPEDEYGELFNKAMGLDYLAYTKKELEKLSLRTSSKSGSSNVCGGARNKNFTGCGQETKCGNNQVKSMKALVLSVKEREISLCNVPIPNTLRKDEVTIQVLYAAGNLTDLYILEGKIPSDQKTIIPGREVCGIVCATGDDVDNIKVGDNVVVAPCQPNTLCPYCYQNCCDTCIKEPCGRAFGINRNGGWAQFATLPSSFVYKITGICLDKAALLPIMAQVMCAMDTMKISEGANILIQGCGLAGMVLTLLLFDKGYKNVFIMEDNPNRVDVIKSMKTCYPVITPDHLPCYNFDIVFSNGSGSHVMELAAERLKAYGQFYVFGQPGSNGSKPAMNIDTTEISKKLLTVKGISGTPVNPSKVPIHLANKILDCAKLGVRISPLDDYSQALTQLTLGDISSLIFKIDKY